MKKFLSIFLLIATILSLLSLSTFAIGSFDDVSDNAWYSTPVLHCVEMEYFNGISSNKFAPKQNMTRAMFVKVLSAMSNEDISEYSGSNFTDVKLGSWYDNAVGWAYEKGIVSGTSATTFSPKSNITRQEICVMMLKYIQYQKLALVNDPNVPTFADDSSISSWAKEAVYAIKGRDIVQGKGNNTFDPKANATRAEVAVMIYNLDMSIERKMKLNVDYVDITIPGAKDNINLLHVSDIHLTLTDDTDPEDAVTHQNTRGALFDAEIQDNVSRTERFSLLNQFYLQNNIDMLVMSGDIIDSPSNGNISYLRNICTQNNVNALYCYGNHDWTGDWMGAYQTTAQWETNTPKFGGIVSTGEDKIAIREYDGFAVIALDNSDNQITLEQYQKLYAYCSTKGKNSMPVILMMHVPLSIDTMTNDVSAKWGSNICMGSPTTSPTSNTTLFCNLLRSKNSTVVAIIAGHVHMDHIDKVSSQNSTIQYTLGASYEGYTRVFNIHG